jgi:hypothetical protein
VELSQQEKLALRQRLIFSLPFPLLSLSFIQSYREDALTQLSTQLNEETEEKILNLNEKFAQERQALKAEHESILRETTESLKAEYEENIRIERLTHERAMDQLRASHSDELNQLTEEKNAIQEQLSKIDAM